MKTEIEKGLKQLNDDIQKSKQDIEVHKKLFIESIKKVDKSRMFIEEGKSKKRGLLWRIKKVLGLI
jgi:hypothetical protein